MIGKILVILNLIILFLILLFNSYSFSMNGNWKRCEIRWDERKKSGYSGVGQ